MPRRLNRPNEVAELYTGDKVQIADSSDSTYWLVYVPGLGKGGYVNKDYLVGGNAYATLYVKSAYRISGLFRSAMGYDAQMRLVN